MITMKIIENLGPNGSHNYTAPSNTLVRIVVGGTGASVCQTGGTQVPLASGTTDLMLGTSDGVTVYSGSASLLIMAQEGIA